MSNKGRLPASGLGAKRPEQHTLFARLHKHIAICSFSLSLSLSLHHSLSLSLFLSPHPSPHSSCSFSKKGFLHLASPILSLPPSPLLCLSGTRTPLARSIRLHLPPAAASHIIRLLARVSSTHLPRHLLHLLPSSSCFIYVTIRSTPSLSVAGSTRVISIKDTASSVRYSSIILFGLHPARPWT